LSAAKPINAFDEVMGIAALNPSCAKCSIQFFKSPIPNTRPLSRDADRARAVAKAFASRKTGRRESRVPVAPIGAMWCIRHSGAKSAAQTRRHTPRKRGIQYAAASRFHRWRLWNTGSSAFADDDSGVPE
jgi:hypothetical protein